MQTETKYTPGPWSQRELPNGVTEIVGAGGYPVCEYLPPGPHGDAGTAPNDADKALIAAAPDLLAALEQLVAAVASDYPAFDADGCLIPARAAIAKAKGGATDATPADLTQHPAYRDGREAMRKEAMEACSGVMDLVDTNRPALDAAERCYVAIRALPGAAAFRQASGAPDLLDALHEGRRAIGDHSAPGDCYATGPMTGDPIRDLIQCPACSFIAMYDAAIAKAEGRS